MVHWSQLMDTMLRGQKALHQDWLKEQNQVGASKDGLLHCVWSSILVTSSFLLAEYQLVHGNNPIAEQWFTKVKRTICSNYSFQWRFFTNFMFSIYIAN